MQCLLLAAHSLLSNYELSQASHRFTLVERVLCYQPKQQLTEQGAHWIILSLSLSSFKFPYVNIDESLHFPPQIEFVVALEIMFMVVVIEVSPTVSSVTQNGVPHLQCLLLAAHSLLSNYGLSQVSHCFTLIERVLCY